MTLRPHHPPEPRPRLQDHRVWQALSPTALFVALLLAIGILAAPLARAAGFEPTPVPLRATDGQTFDQQPPDTRDSFRSVYGEGAEAAWLAAHNADLVTSPPPAPPPPPEPDDVLASLTAWPNPVVTRRWAGTSVLSWTTGTEATGRVFVSINGAPEKAFARAATGRQAADWIWRGSSYEFRLYDDEHRRLVRQVSVSRTYDVLSALGLDPMAPFPFVSATPLATPSVATTSSSPTPGATAESAARAPVPGVVRDETASITSRSATRARADGGAPAPLDTREQRTANGGTAAPVSPGKESGADDGTPAGLVSPGQQSTAGSGTPANVIGSGQQSTAGSGTPANVIGSGQQSVADNDDARATVTSGSDVQAATDATRTAAAQPISDAIAADTASVRPLALGPLAVALDLLLLLASLVVCRRTAHANRASDAPGAARSASPTTASALPATASALAGAASALAGAASASPATAAAEPATTRPAFHPATTPPCVPNAIPPCIAGPMPPSVETTTAKSVAVVTSDTLAEPRPALVGTVDCAARSPAAGRIRPAMRLRLRRLPAVAFALLSTALVSYVVLTTPSRALDQQPFPDAHEYLDAARHLAAGDGYLTTVHDDHRPQPPRYPPGMSLLLMPIAAASGPSDSTDAVLLTTQWLGGGYVISVTAAAWLLGGPLAAGLAALLVGTAPYAIESASLLMSDALVAGLTVLVAALIHLAQRRSVEGRRPDPETTTASPDAFGPTKTAPASSVARSAHQGRGSSTAGQAPLGPNRVSNPKRALRAVAPIAAAALVAGSLALLRLSALAALASLMLAIPTRTWRWILPFAAPGLLALAIFQFSTFGSPLRTGYDYWLPHLKMFDLAYALQRPMGDGPTLVGDALNARVVSWLCPCTEDGPLAALPNVLFYPAAMLGPFWIFSPPFTGALGVLYAIVRCRRDAVSRYTMWLTLVTWFVLSVYVFQAARLAAAPAGLLSIFGAIAVAHGLERIAGRRWNLSLPLRPRRTPSPSVGIPHAPPPAGVA